MSSRDSDGTGREYGVTRNDVAYLAALLSVNVLVLHAFGGQSSAEPGVLFDALAGSRAVVGFLYLSFVPGAVFVSFWEFEFGFARFLLYSLGVSMVAAMSFGGLVSILELGFDSTAFVGLYALIVVLACLAHVFRGDNRIVTRIFHGGSVRRHALVLLSLPVLAVFGVELIESGTTNVLALLFLLAVSCVPMYVVLKGASDRDYLVLIFAISLSLLYYTALFGPNAKGPAISALTLIQGYWEPSMGAVKGKDAVLPNGVLYPMYVVFSGVPLQREVVVFNPIIVTAIPMTLFLAYRRWFDRRLSVLSVLVFMFSFPYFNLYPRGDRVSTPVIFLSLLILVFSDDDLPRPLARALSLLFVAGLTVSHYGTSYLVMFSVLAALVLYWVFVLLGTDDDVPVLLRLSFVAFVVVANLFWYSYTSGGTHIESLLIHMIQEIRGILYLEFAGSGAETLTESYRSISIRWARRIFILFGGMMGLGIFSVAVQKLFDVRDGRLRTVNAEHLALAAAFFMLIGASFLPGASGFNVARIMMITFTICVPFIFVGMENVLRWSAGPRTAKAGYVAVASLIAVFFLLNSGFVAATVSDDYGPNSIAVENRLAEDDGWQRFRAKGCLSCDLQAHVWIREHGEGTIYADQIAIAQTDAYRMALTQELGYFPLESRYTPLDRREPGGRAYVLLLGHNTDTGLAFSSDRTTVYEYDVPAAGYHRIHTTGDAVVHYGNASTQR